MRIVCAQFIGLVVYMIIEPHYRGDVHAILHYFMKLESYWTVADIYNLMKNGILMFQYRQNYFHRYLIPVRNLAVYPSLPVEFCGLPYCVKQVLESRDENMWMRSDIEKEKSLKRVLSDLKHDEVAREEKDSLKQIIDRSQIIIAQ